MKREALKGVLHARAESMTPSTHKEDDRKLTFTIISPNNDGMRYDWYSGDSYIERLDANGANSERLNTFFKDHNRSVDSAVGRIENVIVDGGTIRGDVVFGSGEDEQSIYRKYDEGILTDVSIGYRINKYEVEERSNEPDLVTVTDYDIFEVSAVGIGFDAGAKAQRSGLTEDGMTEAEMEQRISALEEIFGISTPKQGE